MKKKFIILIPVLFLLGRLYAENLDYGLKIMNNAILAFGDGKYNEALIGFREVILDEDLEALQADAYFWISKSYIAMGSYQDAEKNLEFYLLNYIDNDFYEEGLYQKGRLLYLQEDYESCIQVFYNFMEKYPHSIFTSNSYFWIGESLFALGHLDEAYAIFSTILEDYPTSYKIEAANYRLKLIEQKERENELLKLLKMSHENNLKSLEDFQLREKEYEQAIASYQKKIATLTSQPDTKVMEIEQLNAKIVEMEVKYEQLEKEKKSLESDISDYITNKAAQEKTIELLNTTISKLQQELIKAQEEGANVAEIEVPEIIPVQQTTLPDEKLLQIKAEALALKEYYLDYLLENLE